MKKVLIFSSLFFLLIINFAFAASVEKQYKYPTVIPSIPEQQEKLFSELEHKQSKELSRNEWVSLAMIGVILAANKDGTVNKKALNKADKIIMSARELFPNDLELLAIQGSSTCMRAGLSDQQGFEALAYVSQGFRLLDQAVLQDKMNLGARLQRAISGLNSPAFLGKYQRALSDLEFILEKVESNLEYEELQTMLLYMLGEAHHIKNEEKRANERWQKAISLNTGYWSDLAQKNINQ